MSADGWFYDGETANRYIVKVRRDGAALVLEHGADLSEQVPASRLCHVESRGSTEVYGRGDIAGWRLGIVSPDADLLALLPGRERYGRWIDRVGLVRASVIGVAASALVIFAGLKAPEWIAPAVPLQWEERFGDALVGDFGGKGCKSPAGEAALAKLAAKVSPNAKALNIRVVDIGIVNAAALPGGNIVIFDELLTDAKNPDEVAGVLAHEIAHIEERHVTESMIRAFGLGLVVSAFGGTTGGNVETLIAAGHSRASEREADAKAAGALARGNISPLPTAAFFDRMARQERALGRVATGLSYLSTHPLSDERQRLFRQSAVRGKSYAPALTPEEWKALQAICKVGRKR